MAALQQAMVNHRQILRPALFLALLIVVAGCSDASESSTTTAAAAAPTTVTSAPLEAPVAAEAPPPTIAAEVLLEGDLALIRDLWTGESLAFGEGFDEGLEYWVDNNYPAMGCSYDDYLATRFPDGPVDGLAIERVADDLTITRDDGWIVPGGSLAGHAPDGRIYAMSVEATTTVPNTPTEPATTRNLHVVVLDDRAHFFVGCPA